MKTLTELLAPIEMRLEGFETGDLLCYQPFVKNAPDDIKALLEVVRVMDSYLTSLSETVVFTPYIENPRTFMSVEAKHNLTKAREAAAKILGGE